jgi:hypothetical protein
VHEAPVATRRTAATPKVENTSQPANHNKTRPNLWISLHLELTFDVHLSRPSRWLVRSDHSEVLRTSGRLRNIRSKADRWAGVNFLGQNHLIHFHHLLLNDLATFTPMIMYSLLRAAGLHIDATVHNGHHGTHINEILHVVDQMRRRWPNLRHIVVELQHPTRI